MRTKIEKSSEKKYDKSHELVQFKEYLVKIFCLLALYLFLPFYRCLLLLYYNCVF